MCFSFWQPRKDLHYSEFFGTQNSPSAKPVFVFLLFFWWCFCLFAKTEKKNMSAYSRDEKRKKGKGKLEVFLKKNKKGIEKNCLFFLDQKTFQCPTKPKNSTKKPIQHPSRRTLVDIHLRSLIVHL